MSTHSIEIVEIGTIIPHPEPTVTKLEMTTVDGYQCLIGKNEFKTGDKAVYIPPDYMVPLYREEFAFLRNQNNTHKKYERIKVRRLKGEYSCGLLIPVPAEFYHLPVGTNIIDDIGIIRYEPPTHVQTSGLFVHGPLYAAPKFDIEPYQKYHKLLDKEEEIVVTEKIHGTNSRFTYTLNQENKYEQFCGSRNHWMKNDGDAENPPKNIYWLITTIYPTIIEWCKNNPDKVLYGEIFGPVQSLKYGSQNGKPFFAAFAVFDSKTGKYLDFDAAYDSVTPNIKWTPILYRGAYTDAKVVELSSGNSTWPGANHIREGVVVLPTKERYNIRIGRVVLKYVNNEYLLKS